ncbi:hypothetical protein [Mucilaginibacter pedocola]|uniref:DoxX family protein n=1 Tax=Mucilaginibacter pedocola TaxID=1792845 RepID=A0A1S9P762_9SPHI|nr:hypothetical protein [Mucilaginibacter pedocola]OOQ56791.1 hypothetical protein BC343_17550 [Mucilaginibacter pedocola]
MPSTITEAPEAISLPEQAAAKPAENKKEDSALPPWTSTEKALFRVAFIFFLIITIPLNGEWYANLFGINWLHLHYRDLYDVARFSPTLYKFDTPAYNLLGYIDWIEALLIGIVGAAIWTAVDRNKTREYNRLYYWLRVIVRYRAGIGIIGFGFTKLLPTQMPYPSLGLLNTNFGDFTAQKIYWLSIGIVPWYQVFAGVVELAAGALLFFRKTTTLGAILLLGALGDITYVNFAYDGGVHVYASYFVLFSAFLILYDAVPIYNLIIREKFTTPFTWYPTFNRKWQIARFSLKTANIAIFLVLLFYLQYINWRYDPYKQPAVKGVSILRGNYKVSEFKLNGQTIPYSPLDSVRWRDVTFENWSTLTFNANKAVKLDLSNGGGAAMRDINRTFELTGTGGGKRVFYYDADTVNKVLYLQDKYVDARPRGKGAKGKKKPADAAVASFIPAEALANIGDEDAKINAVARSNRRTKGIASELKDKRKRNHMVLQYTANADGSQVVLTGKDEKKNDVYIVLNRVNRKYLLQDSKLVAGEY